METLGGLPVIADAEVLRRRGRATYRTSQTLAGVVHVDSVPALQRVLADARARSIPLYPVSRGRNWGYGSSTPLKTGSILLDLSRMNRITRHDEGLGYVAVQPGVSVAELSTFVHEQLPSRYLPVTGAPPEVSVVGNLLERGQALGPMGDRFTAATNLEVVLADGTVVRTNLGATSTVVADLCKWGQGPLVDGLFTQSNFGVVTEATFLLPRRPRYFQTCQVSVPTEPAFDALVDALHEAMADGLVKETSSVFWNEYKLATRFGRFPARASHTEALPRSHLESLRSQWGGGVWGGRIVLHAATFAEAAGQRAAISRLVRGVGARPLWATGLEDRVRRVLRALPGVRDHALVKRWADFVEEMYARSIFLGVPSAAAVDAVYWRKEDAAFARRTQQPDDDGCGLIWAAFPLPCRGADVRGTTDLIVDHVTRAGFEPMLSVTFNGERFVNEILNLSYDRDRPGEDERAERCYLTLLEALAARGVVPYRLPTLAMRPAPEWTRRLKEALDPDGVLAPGRYGL